MRVVYERCCGLDVHQKTISACLIAPSGQERRSFGTTTAQLRELAEWLKQSGCAHVAMESTGIYWLPIFNVFELAGIRPLLVNARHIKAVPGRKTDVKDAEWIADLLRHGMLRPSFVPDREWRELRQAAHERRSMIEDRARIVNRIGKLLETGNVKLKSVISNLLGVSGRAMLDAIARGETDTAAIAALAQPRLRATQIELQEALDGLVTPHLRFMLATFLRRLDQLDSEIELFDMEIERRLLPFAGHLARLDRIPGVGTRTGQEILAEIGTDMSRFPSADHLCSWAKMCPGLNESAGKRKTTSTGDGNRYLRTALVEAGWAASRTKDTYLRSQYWRIASRRGHKKAVVAVGHTILRICYYLIRDGADYSDLGADYFDQRDRAQATKSAVRRLERLGYHVTIQEAA